MRPACVLVALLFCSNLASGQPPATEPVRGKVLLLDNDRILEGDIDKVDGQYRIRRSIGELWIPASRAKKLCKDLDDAYNAMKSQINLKDADERLRLANWCQMNGLKDRALQEAKIALDMRPGHTDSLKLVQMLQRFAISSSPALATQHPVPTPISKASMTPRVALDVSAESFAFFATRIQPILMNTCVNCHSGGKGGGFQLVRSIEGGSRSASQANLNAVLDFINVEKPVLSPLLIKSVVAHGGAVQAPLKGRQSLPFQSLQGWVDQTLAGNPHLREIRHAETSVPPVSSSTSAKKEYFNEVFAPERPTVQPIAPAPKRDEKKGGEVVSRPLSRLDETPPTVLPTPVLPRDPFDPDEFNARPK